MRFVFYSILFFIIPLPGRAQTMTDTSIDVPQSKEDSTTTVITRLKINSSRSDFSPFLLNDQLIFVSSRPKEVGVQYVDVNNESEITDLYTCTMTEPVKFKSVSPLSDKINTKYYEGPLCFNKQGTVMYYTANDKKTSQLKIYRSEKTNEQWGAPQVLSFCRDGIAYCHPTLSPDESYMIFSAGHEKEKKGMDLYKTYYSNDGWSEPQPLRSEINDSANQVFPFISRANILYFSSDKKNGMGGLDIYSVSLDSSSAPVRPLKAPINSASDDFGVWIDSTSEAGYFSSNRNSRTKDDIYYFTKSVPDFSDAKTVVLKTKFCYTFFEESTMASKDTLNLTYEWNFGDGSKGRGLKTRHCFNGPGDYRIELNIVDKESGEIFTSQTSYSLSIDWPDQLIISGSEASEAGKELQLSTTHCYLKDYEITKVYWSFGDGKYTTGQTVKHSYAKPGSYKVEAGIMAKHLHSGKTEKFKTEKKIIINKPTNDK